MGRIELGSCVLELLEKSGDVRFFLLLVGDWGASCGVVQEEEWGGLPVRFDEGVFVDSVPAKPGAVFVRHGNASPGMADREVEKGGLSVQPTSDDD